MWKYVERMFGLLVVPLRKGILMSLLPFEWSFIIKFVCR